jgi:hypothetical protein
VAGLDEQRFQLALIGGFRLEVASKENDTDEARD